MEEEAPDKSPSASADLDSMLARLELEQYEQTLVDNGFDTWDTVMRITETDLDEMNFKLGHRRKLQRAIHEHQRTASKTTHCLVTNLPNSFAGLPVLGGPAHHMQSTTPTRAKRAYRRHPRPDHNAPQKPKTAYIAFTEHVRKDPEVNRLSFAEIAKEVGKRWSNLPYEERINAWEKPTAERMNEYEAELEQYKMTQKYRSYQIYLKEFKQKQQKQDAAKAFDIKGALTSQPLGLQAEDAHFTRQTGSDSPSLSLSNSNTPMEEQNPVEIGIAETSKILQTLSNSFPQNPRFETLPPEDMTCLAVESFLHGTGSLLSLWTHDEANDLIESIYRSSGGTANDKSDLFAMAALGSYCDSEAISSSIPENFLHLFVRTLVAPSEVADESRMRLFACLAILRFTDDVDSARILIWCALEIGRSLFTSPTLEGDMSGDKVRYWWNAFRTVIFLESWFAYNTGHSSRVSEQDLNLYHTSTVYEKPTEGDLHQRVVELGQLAARIALDPRGDDSETLPQAQTRLKTLLQWHDTLPPEVQMSRLTLAEPNSITWYTRRSILQLHMLFLGLFSEPYRTCLMDLGKYRLGETSRKAHDVEIMTNIENQCVSSARQSARILSLLQSDNLIRSHCWVALYTSFTGCSILLFSASQKLFLSHEGGISQDLIYASSQLNVLSLCSYGSRTARALYTTLHGIFSDIREILYSPAYQAMKEKQLHFKDAAFTPEAFHDEMLDEGEGEVFKDALEVAKRVLDLLQESMHV
ncbi:hypothetical protein EJ08DRAFT_700788 [Tothia fuscella]|uniref:HMG box domain-containing protein n=1 Tax=Tothia fuscella TaxID=1048955 RepID=A0A9P4TUX9_9PEZI|nr:hypothetical protein EJ08DRAFT_700788 [Tothia fuscella]